MSQATIIERLKNSSLPEDAKILLRDLVTYVYEVESDVASLSGDVVDHVAASGH